jgi:hypothetical protein
MIGTPSDEIALQTSTVTHFSEGTFCEVFQHGADQGLLRQLMLALARQIILAFTIDNRSAFGRVFQSGQVYWSHNKPRHIKASSGRVRIL